MLHMLWPSIIAGGVVLEAIINANYTKALYETRSHIGSVAIRPFVDRKRIGLVGRVKL